jgi:hypothetical protein
VNDLAEFLNGYAGPGSNGNGNGNGSGNGSGPH